MKSNSGILSLNLYKSFSSFVFVPTLNLTTYVFFIRLQQRHESGYSNVVYLTVGQWARCTAANFPPIEFSPTKESFQETFRVTGSVPFYILV